MAWNATVTNAGTELLVQWAQGGTLTITGAKSGTEKVNVSQMMAQTDVSGNAHNAAVTRYDIVDSAVKYTLLVTPASGAYSISQFGVFAKLDSGSEILLALYQCDTGEEIAVPASSVMPDFAYSFAAVIAMDNTGNLAVEVDTSALVSQGDMEEALAEKLDVSKVYNGLDRTSSGYALDARQGKTLNDGKVNKSGDTMTGDLKFTSDITPATAPGSTMSVSRISYLDADGNVISILRTTHQTGGAIEAKVIARRIISGNTVLNELGPTINADGSLGYKITDAETFRTAAGAFAAANVYNGLDKTASGFALDARQGKALKDTQTMVGNGAFTLGQVNRNTSKVLTVSTSCHAMLLLSGPSVDMFGLYMIRLGASGAPNVVTITQGSLITFTPGDGKITIGNTATGSDLAVNVIPLSRNSSYFSLT